MTERGLLLGDDGDRLTRAAAALEAAGDLDWSVAHTGQLAQRAVDAGGLAAVVVVEPATFTDAAAARSAIVTRGDPCPVVVLDFAADVDRAVRALRAGVADYVRGDALDRLPGAVREALASHRDDANEARRLETLGRLVDGVAHDTNNALSVILAHSSLLLTEVNDRHPFAEGLDEILGAARRTAILTRRLHAVARRRTGLREHVDLHRVLDELAPVVRRVLPSDVELVLDLPGAGPIVAADRADAEHLILVALLNARDASVYPGEVRVRTGAVTLDADGARPHGLPPGRYVRLECRRTADRPVDGPADRGPSTAVLGLGTAVALTRALDGAFVIERDHDTVALCALLPAQDPRPSTTPTPAEDTGASVLLVEDDPHVRTVTATVLRRAGYRVVASATPGQALLIAEQRPALDLLLADLVLPRLDGTALAERVRATHPTLRVLFMSGHGPRNTQGAPYLPKPFTADDLLHAVRRALA